MNIFKVKKELVIEAANNAMARIDAQKKELFENDVNRCRNKWRILRFFGVKPLSREVAEAFVEHQSKIDASWKIQGWGDRSHAKKLLAACAVTESELVELGIDDANFVHKWL